MNDAMKPSKALLAKLASLIVHQDEYIDTNEPADLMAAEGVRNHPDVKEWLLDMKRLGLAPVKRYG